MNDALAEADRQLAELETPAWRPPVPSGWSYVQDSDHLGVLTPSDAFEFDRPVIWPDRPDVGQFLDRAVELLRRGYPASALLYVRETSCSFAARHHARCRDVGAEAYRKLGRDGLADIHRRRQQQAFDFCVREEQGHRQEHW